MVKYNQSIIYKLCCKDPTIPNIYIGSTTNFTRRKCQHKYSCNNTSGKSFNVYVYNFIRENAGWNNWDMIEIERYEATDKKHLEIRERYWIDKLKPTLNKIIPTRTHREYIVENADKIKDQRKKYRIENAEKIKERDKNYYIENIEKIKERDKKYYIENIEKIKEKHKVKVECKCGSIIRKEGLSEHYKSQKHIKYINSNNK